MKNPGVAAALLFGSLILPACASRAPLPDGSVTESNTGFGKSLAFQTQGLGPITGLASDADGSVLAVGRRGAVRVSAGGELDAPVFYRVPAPDDARPLRTPNQVEPILWNGQRAYLSRGGNWHEVGVYDANGELAWGYRDSGPDWLTAADVDGDGALDYFVGMNGDGGLRRIEPDGRVLWQVDAANVWRVEALQADADPALELIHSDDGGRLWLRDAEGGEPRRIRSQDYVAENFDVLSAPGARSQVVVGVADGLVVADADDSVSHRLASSLDRRQLELTVAARGLAANGGALRWDWLATLSRKPQAELALLTIHDTAGRLVHEEVLLEACASVTWREAETPELLVGCNDRVWSYRPGPPHEPVVTSAEFRRSGSFGPLRFGDSAARVRAALQLEGATCRNDNCSIWGLHLDDRDFGLMPQFENEKLARLTVLGPRHPRSEWRTKVRGDWASVTSELTRDAEPPGVSFPPLNALKASEKMDGWLLAETHHPEREGMRATVGLYGDETGKSVGAIAVMVPQAPGAPVPAAPAAD